MNPYVGHTPRERNRMLAAAKASSVDALFEQIPERLRCKDLPAMPAGLNERALMQRAGELAGRNLPGVGPKSFLGAGTYDHTIPAPVKHLIGRGEFITSYTPYQPEASQGMLQAIFEYQSMICELTGMAIANASLYDGSTALAEAALAALVAARGRNRIVVAGNVHPQYRQTLQSYLTNLPYEQRALATPEGRVDLDALTKALEGPVGAVAIQHPNFFGLLEDMPAISAAVHAAGAHLIVVFDPISLGVLATPGDYGADIAVAEGQPFGMNAYYGGDALGVFACSEAFMRKAPGRLVGVARDRRGNEGYVLALQTREQHIRREKATSNICTNQGLNALKAAITLSCLGPQGLRDIAEASCRNMRYLVERLHETVGAAPAFDGPYFKECAVRFNGDAKEIRDILLDDGYLAGLPLGEFDPSLSDALLLCATETKTKEDLDQFVRSAQTAMKMAGAGMRN